jgi:hypothetical protein
VSNAVPCEDKICTECESIIARTYRELRQTGYGDREAFLAAARVLELRHPGHDRYYYFFRTAQWLGAAPVPSRRIE